MRKGSKHKLDYRGSPEERFWRKVVKGGERNDCWKWTGAVKDKGHGTLRVEKNSVAAHRFSFELHIGDIPAGLFVCHTCDNPPCTNPEHLFLGTNKDNVDDMVAKNRHTYGEKNGQAKFTSSEIIKMRAMKKAGYRNFEIAKVFSASQPAVCHILKGQRWAHIPLWR